MIEHPFLDFKECSDDELTNKALDIQKKLIRAHMWGSSQDIIGQLSWMIEMIEEEKRERLFKQNHDQFNALFPAIVESDPILQQDHENKIEKPQREKPIAFPKRISAFPTTFDKKYLKTDETPSKKPSTE